MKVRAIPLQDQKDVIQVHLNKDERSHNQLSEEGLILGLTNMLLIELLDQSEKFLQHQP